MRTALSILLLLHGAIHALGVIKAFRLAPLDELKAAITPTLGAVWGAAGALLIAAAVLAAFVHRLWCVPALVGILLSQVAIASAWSDAKWGTLANLALLLPAFVAAADLRPGSLRSTYEREAKAARARVIPGPALDEADLAHLPAVVRAYVVRSGAVGKPRVRGFHARFEMKIRGGPDAPWMEGPIEQVEVFAPTERLFFGTVTLYGLPVDLLHRYQNGHATMVGKVLGLFTVVDGQGPEMTAGETVTVLNDMVGLAPGVLAEPWFTWQDLGSREVKVTYTAPAATVSAVLTFDEAGDLVNIVSEDRYQSKDGGTFVKLPWSTPLRAHREHGGARVATEGEARWTERDGTTWTYGTFRLTGLDYGGGW